MKKITESYIDERCGKYIEEYLQTKDVIKLVNQVNEGNEDLLPIVLYLALLNDITELFNNATKQLSLSQEEMVKYIQENREVIEKINNIALFNNPNVAERMNNNGGKDVQKSS